MNNIVEASNLTVRFGPIRAIAGLDVAIPPGSTGILGPNGAGKSTFIKTILGLLKPDAGTARVLGQDVRAGARALRRRVGYMPESDCHLPRMTAVDTVALAAELSGFGRVAAFQRAHEVLHYVGLGEVRYRAVDGFSAGLRQRCKLAAAIVHDPDVIIVDEPTNGLDPSGRRDFLDLLTEVGRQGVSILLTTHLLPDVKEVCERVVVIARGRVLRTGTVAELTHGIDRSRRVRFEGEAAAFLESLKLRNATAAIDPASGDLLVTLPEGADNGLVLAAAAEAGVGLSHLQRADRTLEDVFFESLETTHAPA